MSQLICSPLKETDVFPFVEAVRLDDLRECSASQNLLDAPEREQRKNLRAKLAIYMLYTKHNRDFHSYSLKDQEGNLVAIGGFSTFGAVWFLCTDLVLKHRKSFLLEIKQFRDLAWEYSEVLTNHMMWSNTAHRRFLEAIGAEFSPSDVLQHRGEDFVRFFIVKPKGDSPCVNP